VKLFFDKNNSLLLKLERTGPGDGQNTKERIYSDYRKVDGLMSAMRCTVLIDGKPFGEQEVIDIKYPKNIDTAEFKVPRSDGD
jgi:hypothetical protein